MWQQVITCILKSICSDLVLTNSLLLQSIAQGSHILAQFLAFFECPPSPNYSCSRWS